MAESTQHKLDRVRPPRVQITYDVEIGGAIQKKELPLVLGILSDLSGATPNPVAMKDRKFIENEWGRLNARLHYRMLDVSAWKVVFEGKYKKKFAKPEAHRAMDDIRGSIEELKYYSKKIHA